MDEMIVKAVDKWMYYTQNYRIVWKDGVDVPEVLAEVKFECGFQHTASKFKEFYDANGAFGGLLRMWFWFTKEDRKNVLEWIMDNYKGI